MRKPLLGLIAILMATMPAYSQKIIRQDREIKAMVNEISTDTLIKNIDALVSFGTRHTLSEDISDTQGLPAARRWVLGEFERYAAASNGRMTAEIDFFTVEADGRRIPEDAELGNVMATLKGTDPNDDRVFIVSGHIDSRASDIMDASIDAPGANDDGSGVVALMEMARIMSQSEFPATIIFVAVSGEEQGLYGARHLAEKAKEEEWNLVAMLNNDMISNSGSTETNINDNTRVRIFSEGVPAYETEEMAKRRAYLGLENDSPSRQLARYIKEIGERYVEQIEVVLNYRKDRFLRGGDHTPFSQMGFTAVRVCEMNENYYAQHQDIRVENGIQYGDFPEFMDFEYLRKNAGINLSTLANLAKAPSIPLNVGVDISELSNTTKLQWEAPSNGTAKGYYILMRETSAPNWEQKIYTEDTSITLPYSKDNFFFGVQAVGENGHESLAIIPDPIRN